MQNRFEYLLFITLAKFARTLPRGHVLFLGHRLGDLARYVLPRRAGIARSNLSRAFPERSREERECDLRKNFRILGANFLEMLSLDKISDKTLHECYELHGREYIDQAITCGRGGILLSGHLGFWEAGTFLFNRSGYEVAFVAKAMRNPLVNDYLIKVREASGGIFIDSRKGGRRILKTLMEGGLVGILMDQHAGERQGVLAPFFGHNVWTTPIIAEMAMKYRVPIIPVFARRTASDHHQVIVEPHFFLEGSGHDAVRENTARLNQVIEAAVRRDPGQWFWVHRRWRV